MVMEALEGFQDKVQYDIVGHSGETYYIPFVDTKKPPNDDKARLETIKVRCWGLVYIPRKFETFYFASDDARPFAILLVWGPYVTRDCVIG